MIDACRWHALTYQERFGTWGGLSERERAALLRRRPYRRTRKPFTNGPQECANTRDRADGVSTDTIAVELHDSGDHNGRNLDQDVVNY